MELKLSIVARNRANRVVYRHDGNNMWVNRGRTYLRDKIYFGSTEERRIRYMGFGIGGNLQSNALAYIAPLSTEYPGTNNQNDITLALDSLERPVKITSDVAGNVVDPSDIWLADLAVPTFPRTGMVRWQHVFTETDISYTDGGGSTPYLVVPISEVGLYLSDADPTVSTNELVAYDTFQPIPKTQLFNITVTWSVLFG